MTENRHTDGDHWSELLTDFEGGVAELAEALSAVMGGFAWASEDAEPTVRLIRYYTQEGALDRPERRGKEAVYGFRQIAQFVALRWLLKDGWPLAKASVETASRSTAELLALPPEGASAVQQPSAGRAAALVESFKSEMRPAGPVAAMSAAPPSTRDLQIARSAREARVKRALSAAGADLAPEIHDAVRLVLAPWCAVVVDAERLELVTDEQARALGDAVAQLLIEARTARATGKGRR